MGSKEQFKDYQEDMKQVDERAEKLIRELKAHAEEYLTYYPEHGDKRREIFESWVIQKIAGLQLCIQHLARQTRKIENKILKGWYVT